MGEVDAMGEKRDKHEDSSQGKENKESIRKPTNPQCKIWISTLAIQESSTPYGLVHDVCE